MSTHTTSPSDAQMQIEPVTPSRRGFLKQTSAGAVAAWAGGLSLGFYLPPAVADKLATDGPQAGAADINAWIRISPDNRVFCQVSRSEMGQGTSTSLPMMLAEELECRWDDVRMEFASVNEHIARNKVYITFSTGGSRGTRDSQLVMRKAGATAREMLKLAAAQRWGVPVRELVAIQGKVNHSASKRSVSYGELAAAAAAQKAPSDIVLKSPEQWTLIGKPLKRFDIPAKCDGSAIYGIDVRVPGMLYAALAQCPVFGGVPKSVDSAAVLTRRGIKKVVTGPDFVAVVADNWWRAQQALKAVKVVWDYRGNEKLDDQAIAQTLQAGVLAARSLRSEGDFEATWAAATGSQAAEYKTMEADYFTPYLNHFTLEPQNCTAWVKGDLAEVWAPTQSAEASLHEAAKTLGLPVENVTVHRPYLGGGYGRRGASQDFVRQAVLIARELGGTPVQLLWSREEDMQHGFYRPAALYRQRAVVSKEGRVLAWQARLASQSLLEKIRPASLKNGQDFQAGESFHDMPYQVAHLDLRHGICQINVPVGFWRSVYHSQNPFARESFLDEVLHAAGKDALRGRLELLPAGGRDYKVLEAAAREANWGAKLATGRFQGLAVQDAYGSYAACVVELSVSKQKAVTLHQITIAVDSGQVANVDSARAQIEGNVSYALSSIFMNEINIQDGRVTQSNLADYPLVQLRQIPTIKSVLVPSGGEVWGGLGEPPYAPITPAIANAIAAATGVRLRRTPFSQDGFSLA